MDLFCNSLTINDLRISEICNSLAISDLRGKKEFDFLGFWGDIIDMTHLIEPLQSFKVLAVDRKTGEPRFANVSAPSRKDAEDFVQDMQPEWKVDFHGECEHCDETFSANELIPCVVEPDLHFCEDCHGKLSS